MTIRVNKPTIDFREKLQQLERPVGKKGHDLLKSETTQEARDFIGSGRKNMIRNGNMIISQRYLGSDANFTANNGKLRALDGYKYWCYPAGVNGTYRVQQLGTSPPPGHHKYKRITITNNHSTGANSATFFSFQQGIEGNLLEGTGIGTPHAKPMTLSFWVRSSIAGKRTVSLYYEGDQVTYNRYYEVKQPNVWEHVSVTYPARANTGSLGASKGVDQAILFDWSLGMGSTYSTTSNLEGFNSGKYELAESVKLIEHNGATMDITGIQLEIGATATDFDYRSIQEELEFNQRYMIAYGGSDECHLGVASAYTSANINLALALPTTMRTGSPTFETMLAGGNWLQSYVAASGANSNATPVRGEDSNNNVLRIYLAGAHSGLSLGQALWCQVLPNAKLIVTTEY